MSQTILERLQSKYRLEVKDSGETEIADVTRMDLAKLIHELDFKIGAEVGVAAGVFTEILLKTNPQLEKLYGIDPWAVYQGYDDYTQLSTLDNFYEEATRRTAAYPNCEFIKEFSMDAVKRFADDSLDFVYIDANHTDPYVTQDVNAWARKVHAGGIICGDDFVYPKFKGQDMKWRVKDAVRGYAQANNKPLFIWGLEAKLPGLARDHNRNWMILI